MVADVDGDDGVVAAGAATARRRPPRRTRRGLVRRRPAGPFPPARWPTGPPRPGAGPRSRVAPSPSSSASSVSAASPSDPGADRVEAADRGRVVVDLHDGLVRRDPGVVGEGGADHDQQVGLVHQPARHRRAAAAEHPGAQRVGVRDQALGLERGQDRRVEPLGQAAERPGGLPGAVPGDQHRPPAGRDHGGGAGQLRLAGLGEPPGQPALRGLGGGVTGLGLDLVGQHQVGDAAGVQGMLDRQGGQLGVVAAGVHVGGPGGHVAEDSGQVEILEGPAPEDLGGHLTGDGQDR